MIRFRSARWWLLGCLAVCVSPLWGQPPQPAPAPPLSQVKLPARPEPLDQLRDALQTLVLDNTNREEYAFRKTKLEKAIHGLRPADYGPALALPEWRDLDRDEGVAAVDRPLRRDLIQRYRDWVVKVLQQRGADSVDVKLAVLTQAARLANHARGEA
ncbi:MAG: hypothetical protein JNM56_36095, partial [Planctomycetia bacterium]|nr:hypothetical protein [Planctomycetia bacterium]